jgi:hypothetical protein
MLKATDEFRSQMLSVGSASSVTKQQDLVAAGQSCTNGVNGPLDRRSLRLRHPDHGGGDLSEMFQDQFALHFSPLDLMTPT